MRYRRFEPLDRDLSVLVLGTAGYERAPVDAPLDLLDSWLELGGNVVDTARRYGNAETIVGRWLRERDLYEDVLVITKGGHYDVETGRQRITEDDLTSDLAASRAQLGLETIDLYLLHRDDRRRAVASILEDVEAFRQSGAVRLLGASNWTTERLEEAGRAFACSSPGFSLAVAAREPWPGCVTIHDEAALAWYARTQLPVFAWSSLASGFFTDELAPGLEPAYVTDDNLERRRRARELAARKGCTPAQVALAWVVQQPFPVYAVIGPRTVAELEESVGALDVHLADDERAWLDLSPSGRATSGV